MQTNQRLRLHRVAVLQQKPASLPLELFVQEQQQQQQSPDRALIFAAGMKAAFVGKLATGG